MAAQRAEQLMEYLKRVMLHPATVSQPRDVAWFLASYARDALARLSGEELPGLKNIRIGRKRSLGGVDKSPDDTRLETAAWT